MKRIVWTGMAIFLTATTLSANAVSQVAFDKNEVERQFIGKSLSANGIEFTIRSDGTILGDHRGMVYEGTWGWNGQYFCRSLRVGGRSLGSDCQVISVENGMVSFQAELGATEQSASFMIN